ncbi:hypothetical protein Zmor_016025 [Zophobas morio]|uniref:Sodium/potassium-transporting ATPase subunit beta-2 n=1 Tax=Zophobas morio TaxID=2755281 RepID=A0AA38IL50_9CUCU|nr:hypothetical protein Zmor_016025 [Zophobas morio]
MHTTNHVATLLLIYLSWTSACQSRIKNSPVLEFRPLPKESDSTLVWIQGRSEELYQHWIDSLTHFLEPYFSIGGWGSSNHKCSDEPPPKGSVCAVKVRDFWPCSPENRFGYDRGEPCIFLRLGDIPKGWIPELYNSSNVPKEMPDFLKNLVREEEQKGKHSKVWVSCDGDYPADKEYIGPVTYYPGPAFPAYHFHAADNPEFLNPLVAVKFERANRGVIINVVCTAWAANIPRDAKEKLGTLNFELSID